MRPRACTTRPGFEVRLDMRRHVAPKQRAPRADLPVCSQGLRVVDERNGFCDPADEVSGLARKQAHLRGGNN